MEIEYDIPPPRAEPSRTSWFELAMVAGFFLSLLIGIVALATFFLVYSTSEPELDASPIAALPIEQILPQLALQELAGDPANALAYQALSAGELATAHAALLFDTKAYGSRRAGLALQLGRRYLEASQPYRAAMVYRLAAALAILDPTLAPVERNKMLIPAADGLLQAGEPELALEIAQQASLVGQQIPELLPAQRNEIFSELLPIAQQLDDPLFEQQVTELARNPYLQPSGILFTPILTDFGVPLPLPPELTDVVAARELSARRLIERILFTAGTDIEPEINNLADALLTEDRVRRSYFDRMLAAPMAQKEQFQLLHDHRSWLVQQLHIAHGAYGLSIIPEWETDIGQFQGELATVNANLDVTIDTLAETQLAPLEKTLVRAEGLMWLALQSELDLYPNPPLDSLQQRIRVINDTLAQFGEPLALPFGYDADAIPPGFRIFKVQP